MQRKNILLQHSIALALISCLYLPIGVSAETINMSNQTDLAIATYQGDNTYLYTHDSNLPSVINGGKIAITSASGKNNQIHLQTDSSGINITDKTVVESVLNGLAQKLTYTNYSKEYNLTGFAEIAEGLTGSSFVTRYGYINFENKTGQGSFGGTYNIYSRNKFATVITGDVDKDTEYAGYIVSNPNNTQEFRKIDYAIGGMNIFKPGITSTEVGGNFAAIQPSDGKEFWITAGTSSGDKARLDLTDIKTNSGKVYGIYNDKNAGVYLYVPGGVEIIGTTDGTYNGGIYAGSAKGNTTSVVKVDSSYGDGLQITCSGKGFVAIEAGHNGQVISTGRNTINVSNNGCGIIASDGGIVQLTNNDGYNYINAEGGIAAYAKKGGQITIGKTSYVSGDLVAEGDGSKISITVGSDYNTGKAWDGNAIGHVDVNFNAGNSLGTWNGTFDSDGTMSLVTGTWNGNAKNAGASIILSDKALWNGNLANGADLTLLGRSLWNNTSTEALTIGNFTGSDNKGLRGIIVSNSDLTFGKYSGMSIIGMKHDASDPTKIIGGNVTVKSATKDSAITLRTDSSGIDMTNDESLRSIFTNMAQKLTYSAYTSGEDNLDGYVEIAEGLTAGAVAQKISDITFDKTTGKGSVGNDILTPINAVITGNITKDSTYVDRGILTVDDDKSTYNFTQKTIINNTINVEGATPNPSNMKYAIAINPDAGKEVILNMNGNDLVVENNIGQGQMAQSTSAIIYALAKGSKITINDPGAIDLSTFSQAYYAAGMAAGDRYASAATPCEVTINNAADWNHAVKIRGKMGMGGVGSGSIFNVNWTGIKTFNHGHVDIKGYADMYSFGAWCLSAIGDDGYINIGGGKLVSQDYAAVDAYSAGTIRLNTTGTGVSMVAGNNDLMVEGNLRSTGQWVGAGSGGIINAAFINKDSYLAGIADSPVGEVNIALQNGALWTNQDGGFRYGDSSSFDATKESTVNNFYGGKDRASEGTIYQKQNGDITIKNYQGYSTICFDRDTKDLTKILGGDVIVNHASKDGSNNASIAMRTDSSGLDLNNAATVTSVLNNLAGKLYYYGYTIGEENLSASAEIAEGLTSSSIKKNADILFDKNSGVGRVTKDPLGQTVTAFETSIVADANNNKEYKKAGVVVDGKYVFDKTSAIKITSASTGSGSGTYAADKTAISVYTPYEYGVDPSTINYNKTEITAEKGLKIDGTASVGAMNKAGIQTGNGTTLTINGDIDINLVNYYTNGASRGIVQSFSNGNPGEQAITNINGDVTVKIKNNITDGNGTIATLTPRTEHNIGIVNAENNGSILNINGLVDLDVDGTGIIADGRMDTKGIINVKGGRIITPSDKDTSNHSLTAYSGTINLNMSNADSAKSIVTTTPGISKVEVEGNILTMKDENAGKEAYQYCCQDGTINMALTTSESYWKGIADNAGISKLGTFNLYLQNGALWMNNSQGKTYNYTEGASQFLNGAFDGTSHVTNFVGGSDKAHMGIIAQGDTAIAIDNYSGNAMVIYGHNSQQPNQIVGGDISIKHAAAGSGITLMTDRDGINLDSSDGIKNVFNALAAKLTYLGAVGSAEKNLDGRLVIGEGLTAAGVEYKVGDMAFSSATGKGSLVDGSVVDSVNNPIYQGQYETLIMSGTKSAMASAALMWRSGLSDLDKRLGDLRLAGTENGIWANIYGGKSKLDKDNTEYSTSYKAYQLGYDFSMGKGWRAGAAVSYTDGNGDYVLGGKGDLKNTTISLYGTWKGEQGHYADIVLKGGQVENDFKVYNEMGHKVEGNYKTKGYSISAEYGRRIENSNGFYVEPQAQLTWGKLNSKDYSALSDMKDSAGNYRNMDISQAGFDSLIGRLGVGIGRNTRDSSVYFKASLAHEFQGDFNSSFIAEETKSAGVNLGGTWAILQLGGSKKTSANSYLYGNIEKSIGGDAANDWRADIGMRWTF